MWESNKGGKKGGNDNDNKEFVDPFVLKKKYSNSL